MACVLPAGPALLPASVSALNSSVFHEVASRARDQQQLPKRARIRSADIGDLPDELILSVVNDNFDARDLCTLAQVSQKFRKLSSLDKTWKRMYEERYGDATGVTHEAAALARSWKGLYGCKLVSDKQAEPWLTPCAFELAAVLDRIAKEQAGHAGGVLFLLDGSGSVYQSDFQAMTQFVSKAYMKLMQSHAATKVGVIQFSTGTHVHLPLDNHEENAFNDTVSEMARMNGGTNLALAIEEAGKMMKECLPEGSPRTLVLLSDGRVDHYQGQQTVQMVKHVAQEQGRLSGYAFGVGCGVAREDLSSIVSACGHSDADCRYMHLAVHPDPDYRW